MMYLSRLLLDARSREVQREIANPYEMHRTVLRGFPTPLPSGERVLFRLETSARGGVPVLLVQSMERPDWGHLDVLGEDYLLGDGALPADEENPAVKELAIKLRADQLLAFRLRANPTMKESHPGTRQGRRVGLYRDEDQIEWLRRKLSDAGAQLLDARSGPGETVRAWLNHDGKPYQLTLLSVPFDGVLRIRDPERLIHAMETGIGSGKGLGFGLLSLAPAT